jgi:hypothetical protein
MIMQGTEQPLSQASITHLRKVAAEIGAFLEAGGLEAGRLAPERSSSLDAAWAVLEAAIDFGDAPTIEACRRVIDASLNSASVAEADLLILDDYFK